MLGFTDSKTASKGYTKLKKAFTEYGYINFTFTVLATIRYNNSKELYELEDKYIDTYLSIEKTDTI